MKKLFTICMILILTGLTALAQNPFIRDDNSKSTYLKFDTDKTGFGTVTPAEKVTIQSSAGETNLGLKPAKNQSNSLIKFYNSAGVVIAELRATKYGNKNYLKIDNAISTPQIYCTGSSGPILTSTNGGSWQVRVTSAGVLYTVTPTQ